MITKNYKAFLFDMDGTILISKDSAERVWGAWAQKHDLEVTSFLQGMHGSRAEDTIFRTGLKDLDPTLEAEAIIAAEMIDMEGIREVPGASQFLASLPKDKWVIVTSSPLRLAMKRLEAADLPTPDTFVSAEEVDAGKPDPECYILAAHKLGVDPVDCLVFEDAEVGFKAAAAAGMDVVRIGKEMKDYHQASVHLTPTGLMELRQTSPK